MVERILISALVSYGYCACFWEGMIFYKVGEWVREKLPEWVCKPLFDCCVCNAFWIATFIYWLYWGSDWKEWILISIGSVGVNAIVANMINKIEDISNPPQ